MCSIPWGAGGTDDVVRALTVAVRGLPGSGRGLVAAAEAEALLGAGRGGDGGAAGAGGGARRAEAVRFAEEYADLDPSLWDAVDRIDAGAVLRVHGWELPPGMGSPNVQYVVAVDGVVREI